MSKKYYIYRGDVPEAELHGWDLRQWQTCRHSRNRYTRMTGLHKELQILVDAKAVSAEDGAFQCRQYIQQLNAWLFSKEKYELPLDEDTLLQFIDHHAENL